MTKVVNILKEPCDVYIGRGSRWGNPFRMPADGTREQVIEKYEAWLNGVIDVTIDKCKAAKVPTNSPTMEEIMKLKGKKLGCFCAPLPCHGEVFIRMIEEHENG